MWVSRKAITKIQSIAIIAIVVVASIAGIAYYFITTKPKEEKVELVLLSPLSEPHRQRAVQDVIDKFQYAYPNIEVKLEIIAWAELATKIIAMVEAGTPPDIAIAGSGTPLLFHGLDAVAAVDDVIEELGGEENFLHMTIQEDYGDDHFWGITLYQSPNLIIYRKDWFAEKGIEVPADGRFHSWQEFYDAAKMLTEDTDGDGVIDRYGYGCPVADIHGSKPIWNFMMTNNATTFDENNNLHFNTPETRETYEFLVKLYKDCSPPGIATYGWSDGEMAIKAGLIAMHQGWGGTLNGIADTIPEMIPAYGVMDFPFEKTRGGQKGTVHIQVFKGDHEEESKKFLAFLFQDANYIPLLLSMYPAATLPATVSASNNPVYLNSPEISASPWTEDIKFEVSLLPYQTVQTMKYGANPWVAAIEGKHILQNALLRMLVEGWTADEALTEAEEEITDIMTG